MKIDFKSNYSDGGGGDCAALAGMYIFVDEEEEAKFAFAKKSIHTRPGRFEFEVPKAFLSV